jgi:hypothetical protein
MASLISQSPLLDSRGYWVLSQFLFEALLLYPRTFSTDLDNLICESQGGEKGKWDANGGRRSSIPRMQRIGITGLLTKYNDLKYLPARLCLLSPSMAAIAF